MKIFILFLLILGVYVLHQDYWNWNNYEPLVFGFLPLGLAYHAGFAVLCSILLAILVATAWPKHLEDTQPLNPDAPKQGESH